MPDVAVTNNPDRSRYEAHLDGKLAGFAEYQLTERVIVFTHTEVDDAFAGMGVGGALVRGALDDVRASGTRRVKPVCEFVRAWIDKHPAHADLLRDEGLSA